MFESKRFEKLENDAEMCEINVLVPKSADGKSIKELKKYFVSSFKNFKSESAGEGVILMRTLSSALVLEDKMGEITELIFALGRGNIPIKFSVNGQEFEI